MTIVRKMIFLVATAILGLAGLAWIDQSRMEAIYEKTNVANVDSIPGIVTLNKANEAFGRLRVRIYRHVLNNDASKTAELEAKIEEAQNWVLSALQEYDKLVSDDKDKQMLAEDRAAFKDYVSGLEDTLVLSREHKFDLVRERLVKNASQAEHALRHSEAMQATTSIRLKRARSKRRPPRPAHCCFPVLLRPLFC